MQLLLICFDFLSIQIWHMYMYIYIFIIYIKFSLRIINLYYMWLTEIGANFVQPRNK